MPSEAHQHQSIRQSAAMHHSAGFIPELEHEVLGALLVSKSVKLEAAALRPEHFIEPLHRLIFENISTAAAQYGSASAGVVLRMFTEQQKQAAESALGFPLADYLARLTVNCVRGPAGLKTSISAVMQQWGRLALGEEAAAISEASQDPGADPLEMARHLSRAIDDIASPLGSGRQIKTRHTFAEASAAALQAVQDAIDRGHGLTGTTWGLADVNHATGGIQRGEMTVIGARPSMGKTAVALSIALKAARSNVGVGFVSLEMGAKTLAMRALTDLAYDRLGRVHYADLIAGRVSPDQFAVIEAASDEFGRLPLLIEDAPNQSVTQVRAKLDRMCEDLEKRGASMAVLVVDYLQLVAASSRYQGNRVHEITEISAGLRNMAREYDIAVLALSQLSRGVETREDKRPMMSDLRDSGSIEQDADTIVFLYREAYYLAKERGKDPDAEADRLDRLEQVENKLEFIIAKQRNGPVKSIDLFIDIACSAVRNAVRV
ncbi:replicative DNA helicase [Rhizobium sp. YIM 134829]|uniref:replicative DNA helicase n=1 Tax=Rhizobium sp. YIM 134829 TaxID=3390453 RepID=UPI00397E64BA